MHQPNKESSPSANRPATGSEYTGNVKSPSTPPPVAWNATQQPWPETKCIHELFEEQVCRTPTALAVEAVGGSLTYAELNERANKVARHLQSLGVTRGSLVGISLERSLEVVVGIYGILKAGGTYVPLDPTYPQDRLSYMVEAAQCGVLITQRCLSPIFVSLPGVKIVELDSHWPEISQNPGENLGRVATPDDRIYVIFTSGSTGKPKGAAVYHRGFTNLLHWFVTDFQIDANDRALLVSSLSFDLTQKNLYATLIRGGRLHLYPPAPYDVSLLRKLVQNHEITLLNCTPSAFYPLIEPASPEAFTQLASLRIVFLGGENISIPRVRSWMTNPLCRADVANTYGPTECTDICGAYRMTRANMDAYSFVPLGRPVFNVQLAIVDAEMHHCPPGVAGELCVAGAGVGAGYINDPAMTAAKFIPNPLPDIAGPTLYHTGDQARWLPDGVIEFLGRLDHQVKIRGFRIELNEIEAALDTHSAMREAIVVVKDSTQGNEPRLVCYFTEKSTPTPTTAALREHLRTRLPDYMVPAAFHRLDNFPLSPNGKVDRRAITALPEPVSTTNALETPTSEIETIIRKSWADTLGRTNFGLEDNFFDVGGDSIQIAQIHMRLQAELKKTFPITDLFAHTTIRALVTHFGAQSAILSPSSEIQDRARRQREAIAARRNPRRT